MAAHFKAALIEHFVLGAFHLRSASLEGKRRRWEEKSGLSNTLDGNDAGRLGRWGDAKVRSYEARKVE